MTQLRPAGPPGPRVVTGSDPLYRHLLAALTAMLLFASVAGAATGGVLVGAFYLMGP